MESRRVVISGLGVVSPYGIGEPVFRENIFAGKSAASLINSFDVSNLPTKFAASLPLTNIELGRSVRNQKILKTLSRSGMMAIVAATEAMDDASFLEIDHNPYRIGTSLGAGGVGLWDLDHSSNLIEIFLRSVNIGDEIKINNSKIWSNVLHGIHPLTPLKGLSNIPTAQISIMSNARGICQTITTACTSSAQAIGEAYRQIKGNIADVIITGGSDSMINPYGLVAFSTLGVMSTNNEEWQTAARPFDRRRDGFMVGEGAAVFILEELDYCLNRGAKPYAEIIGYASTCDAFRLTDEPPDARGSVEAMKLAIEDSGINSGDIDYINAHGTGTTMNDRAETKAIKSVFGDHAYSIPISSTKSMIGHLVAAAGAVEFAVCVLALNHQMVPPTINYEEADDICDLDYVVKGAQKKSLKIVLSNSFGFGGQNACLIVKSLDFQKDEAENS